MKLGVKRIMCWGLALGLVLVVGGCLAPGQNPEESAIVQDMEHAESPNYQSNPH